MSASDRPGTTGSKLSSPPFSLRKATPEDVRGIAALLKPYEYADGSSEEAVRKLYEWQFASNPIGAGEALVAVDVEGKIVGHEGFVPMRLVRQGRTVAAALPGKLVVHERFRKSMLFLRLESRFLASYQASGIEFLYCTARNDLKAHYALGFRSIGTIGVLARPYRLGAIARRALGSFAPLASVVRLPAEWALRRSWTFAGGKIAVQQASRFSEELEPFLTRTQRCFEFAAERRVQVLNWRFGFAPRGYVLFVARDQGEPVGYIVLRDMPMGEFRTLAVVDLFHDPRRSEVGAALLRAAHRTAVALGVELASCLISPGSPLYPVVRRAGFLRTPESFELMVHQPKGSTPLDNSDFASWHVTWFDHDYV
ncbi:MAG: GNAT family N-acetyltransferase [Candidatus Korobacteraceae bacterium]